MLDRISDWLSVNKGAPVLLGVLLVILNMVLQLFVGVPVIGALARANVLLHLGVIIGLVGILVGDAL